MPPQEREWSKQRKVAQPYLKRAVRDYEVFERWYEDARETEISYRRTDMLSDWRNEKSLVLNQALVESLRPETPVPERAFTRTEWPGMTRKYHYIFRYSGYDTETEEIFTDRNMSFGTDTELLPGEAEARFFEILSEMAELSPITIEEQHLMAVRRRTW